MSRLRSWAGTGILFLVGTALQVGGYQNPTLAAICFGIAALWTLYLVVTWPPVKRCVLRLLRAERPSHRIEPYLRSVGSSSGPIVRYEAGVRVVNSDPTVCVQGVHARITECTPFFAGGWSLSNISKFGFVPWFTSAAIRRVEGESGTFGADVRFVVANREPGGAPAYLAIDEPVRSRNPLTDGPYGIRIEVGTDRPNSPPVEGRFVLVLGGHSEPLRFVPYTETTEPPRIY
jgi:hypothetical protein